MAVTVGVQEALDRVASYKQPDMVKFLFEQGKDYEKLKFAELAANLGSEFVEIPEFSDPEQTRLFAKSGKIAIAQAPLYLSYDEFDYSARADLLLRSDYDLQYNEEGLLTAVPIEGAEVDGLYCVWDVKHSAEKEPAKSKAEELTKYQAQLAMSYEVLLDMGIGSSRETGLIYKGDDLGRFDPEVLLEKLRAKRGAFFEFLTTATPMKAKNIELSQLFCADINCTDAYCEYPTICSKAKVDTDQITQIYMLNAAHKKKLKESGLDTIAKIHDHGLGDFGFPDSSLRIYEAFVKCIMKAKASGKPEYELIAGLGDSSPLPAQTDEDLFIDFETYTPLNQQRKFYYMLGVADMNGDVKQYVANDESEETAKFNEFVERLERAIATNPEVHFYHVNHTEATETRALAANRLSNERLENLLSHYVDLVSVARKMVAVSTGGFGLKKIEKFFPEKVLDGRDTETEDGADSLWQYYCYQKAVQAGDTVEAKRIMDDIAKYNAQDCLSLRHYYDWLASIG
jgi:predicted RecB family nuclease